MIALIPSFDNPSREGPDAFIATATALTLAGIAASSAASTYAAHKQSSSADKSAQMQTQSANQAAQLQSQSNSEALKFQQQEAANARADAERTQHANYDMWAAKERRMGSLGALIGQGNREIPAYQPMNPTGAPAAPGAPQPSGDLSSAQASFDKLFPDATLTPQMVKAKEAELKALGFTLRPNAAGVVGKVQYGGGPIIDIIQGAGSGVNKKQWLLPTAGGAPSPAPQASPYGAGSIGALAQPQAAPSYLTPALQAPSLYRPGSLGSLTRN